MKLKIGDKVKIRDDLISCKVYDNIQFVSDMKQYCGKVATIIGILGNIYSIDLDNLFWNWSDKMFVSVIITNWKEEMER